MASWADVAFLTALARWALRANVAFGAVSPSRANRANRTLSARQPVQAIQPVTAWPASTFNH